MKSQTVDGKSACYAMREYFDDLLHSHHVNKDISKTPIIICKKFII